jgi:hypothetical protein
LLLALTPLALSSESTSRSRNASSLPAEDIKLAQAALATAVGERADLQLIGSGHSRALGQPKFAVFSTPRIEYRRYVWESEQVYCSVLTNPPTAWRCDSPRATLTFVLGEFEHEVRLSEGLDAETVLDVSEFMFSPCFRSQISELPPDRNLARPKPFDRVRIIGMSRTGRGWLRVRTGSSMTGINYEIRSDSSQAGHCKFQVTSTSRFVSTLMPDPIAAEEPRIVTAAAAKHPED